ncbi:hypothetical protein [Silicimonas sp. MF1-12-2]|uniref:hypothetical protein n=1 Tax=Silicimonas sp. MF1-12-2 TaxID=3384793 RepID=UPI0039B53952
MSNKFKGPLTALMVSSLAIVPAATIAYVAMADVAFAKSDKAGGNGNGKGGSAKSSAGGSKGNSGTKSASSSSGGGKSRGHGGLDNFFQKLTGKDKAKSAKSKSTGNSAKLASAEPKERPVKDAMHPSNLGNMNGALNANINAVLAHIKNGNTNGPVGAMALLAVAKTKANEGQVVLDLQQDFLTLEGELQRAGYESVEDYFAALDGKDPIEPIQPIEDAIGALASAEQSEADLKTALEGAGFFGDTALDDYLAAGAGVIQVDDAISAYTDPVDAQADLDQALADAMYQGDDPLADYLSDKAGTPPADEDTVLNGAIENLDGDVASRTDVQKTEPSEEEVTEANEKVAGQAEAEAEVLALWNKSGTAPAETEAELLAALHERLDAEAEAIAAAVAEVEADVSTEEEPVQEELTECDAESTECAPDEEIAAVE